MSVSYAVVVICYNQEHTITECVDSILAQSASDRITEVHLVDDGSTDASMQIMQQLAERDARITVHTQPNSGGCSAPRNRGIRHVSADYIGFLDGDDIWLPHKVERELKEIDRNGEIGLLYSDLIEFDDETGEERLLAVNKFAFNDTNQFAKLFIYGGPIIPSCAVVRRDVFDKVGLFDEEIPFNEDSEMWLRIAGEFKLHHIGEPLMRKRSWLGSLGSEKYRRENIAVLAQLTDQYIERYPELEAYRNERDARIHLAEGKMWLKSGDRRAARKAFWNAAKLFGTRPKIWAYLFVSILPFGSASVANAMRTLQGQARRKMRGHHE